jgi:DNA-binding winged helix-turn-helix (wHTH) protein/TolB-like protein
VLHFCANGGVNSLSIPLAQPKRCYRFGVFEAGVADRELLRQGVRLRLQDQPFRVLTILLEHAGDVVTREELRQRLWPADTYVEFDGSLNAALKRLRSALGDSADNPVFIETVPKRGYRFIAPVTSEVDLELAEGVGNSTTSESLDSLSTDDRSSAWRSLWWVTSAVAVLMLLAGWRYTRRSAPRASAPAKVVAVLPFSNEGAGPDFDYLRYAIANDLVSDLTSTHSVAVRPFASTSKYGSQSADPATVGKELRVTYVVAGGFLLDNQNLRVNLEVVDVEQNQPVWREEVAGSPQDLVALHDRIAVRVAQGLLPAINISKASPAEMPSPKNEQALDLFLHSITVPLDPEPNLTAIKMLEGSVSLDSGYAPAWGELGWRYYIDYHYGNGGKAAESKALQAYKRQSELDPNVPAISTTIRVEQGDLNGAYDQAMEFLRRRPDVSIAHYSMSYVLRYAGLLDEASKECDNALAIDPGFNVFRSCATPFILSGDYPHALRFIHLDENSGPSAEWRMVIALRTGNTAAVLEESGVAVKTGTHFADLARSCLSHGPEEEVSKKAKQIESDPRLSLDAEEVYRSAEFLGFCGFGDAALRQLRKAIAGNYCSYPALDKDPLFNTIRQRTEFAELRQAGLKCQQSFQNHRQQATAGPSVPSQKFN